MEQELESWTTAFPTYPVGELRCRLTCDAPEGLCEAMRQARHRRVVRVTMPPVVCLGPLLCDLLNRDSSPNHLLSQALCFALVLDEQCRPGRPFKRQVAYTGRVPQLDPQARLL